MSSNTPYTPPKSTVADVVHEYGELKIFSANGRIGRVRYLAWSMGFWLLSMTILGMLVGLAGAVGGRSLAMTLYFAGIVVVLVVSSLFAMQRLHDLDKSGWLYLVMLIPLIGGLFALYVVFAPGSKQANRYGNPPPPNSTGAVVLAWLMPMVAIIGILAAIAIPAYQGYVKKAQQAQMQTQPSQQP